MVRATDVLEGDFLGVGLRGDLLGARGIAAGSSGPGGILPPAPDEGEGNGEEEEEEEEEEGRVPMNPGSEEDSEVDSVGIAETAKEEGLVRGTI